VASAVASDRMRSHTKKLITKNSAHHSGCHKPLGIRRTIRDGTNRDTPTCILLPSISCDSDWIHSLRCAALYLSGATCNDSVVVLLFRLVQLPPPRRWIQVRLKFRMFFANPIVMSRTPNPTTIAREMMSQSTSKSESNSRSFILRVCPPVLTVQDSH
jgi:hypothetical protein